MKTQTLSFKTSTETKNALIAEARRLNVTTSHLISEKLARTTILSTIARDTVETFAQALKVNQSTIVDILTVDFAARRAAEREVLGRGFYETQPFIHNMDNGKLIKGDELFIFLKRAYSREIQCDDDLIKRAKRYNNERREALQTKYANKVAEEV